MKWIVKAAKLVEHRRDVPSGDLWACAAGGFGGGMKSTGGSAGVWTGAGDGAEDAGIFGSAGLPAAAAGEAAQAGAVAGRDRRHSGRRQEPPREAAAHGQADLRSAAGGARIHRRLHDREGLRALGEAAAQEMFIPLTHAPGEAQADFGEAVVIAGGEAEGALPGVDLPHSDDCFVLAFPAETTEAFLEGQFGPSTTSAAFPRGFSTTTRSWRWRGFWATAAAEDAGVLRVAEPLSVRREVRTTGEGQRQRQGGGLGRLRAAQLPGADSASRQLGGVERAVLEAECRERRERRLRGHQGDDRRTL